MLLSERMEAKVTSRVEGEPPTVKDVFNWARIDYLIISNTLERISNTFVANNNTF